MNGLIAAKPSIGMQSSLAVERDLSGGVRVRVGDKAFVLPPQEAVRFAVGILKAAGLNVEITGTAHAAVAAADARMKS